MYICDKSTTITTTQSTVSGAENCWSNFLTILRILGNKFSPHKSDFIFPNRNYSSKFVNNYYHRENVSFCLEKNRFLLISTWCLLQSVAFFGFWKGVITQFTQNCQLGENGIRTSCFDDYTKGLYNQAPQQYIIKKPQERRAQRGDI